MGMIYKIKKLNKRDEAFCAFVDKSNAIRYKHLELALAN
jgi:hypothetical protein